MRGVVRRCVRGVVRRCVRDVRDVRGVRGVRGVGRHTVYRSSLPIGMPMPHVARSPRPRMRPPSEKTMHWLGLG